MSISPVSPHAASADTDHDGLSDALEGHGWRTASGAVFHTDPLDADTDGDNLPDGVEAGEVVGGHAKSVVFSEVADPIKPDTDRDGVGDADEYLLATDPRNADTDHDRLGDSTELNCGSDPTAQNPDGDIYPDAKECERGSDPLAFDLTHAQAVAAVVEGATFGEGTAAARRFGRLSEAQTESPEYLFGQIVGDFVPGTAVRDLIADLGEREFGAALLDLAALAPVAGGAAGMLGLIVKFAKRGERAQEAAVAIAARGPWSKEVKAKILATIWRAGASLPAELKGGKRTYSVYRSSLVSELKYVGISNNPDRRWAEHARDRRGFTPELIPGATGLSKGEARAIEEACIVRGGSSREGGRLINEIHSILPSLPYYPSAVRWGDAWLERADAACPA